jgi:hypothetical protein
MTHTVTLDNETEKIIERKATRLGITPSEYLRRLVEKSAKSKRTTQSKEVQPEFDKPKIKTGADLLAALDALGLPSGYGDPNIDAPTLARQLRKQSETRDWS